MAITSVSAFAQTLNSSYVTVDGNPALIEITEQTPKDVTLQVKVPTQVKKCNPEDYAYREVERIVGYDSVPRVVCNGRYGQGGHHGNGGVVVRRRTGHRVPTNGGAPRRGPNYNPNRGRNHQANNCHTVYDRVPRYGIVTEKYCLAPYYTTVNIDKSYKLKIRGFKKSAQFEFALDAQGNVKLDAADIAADCVRKKVYTYKNKAKLKLKRRCR